MVLCGCLLAVPAVFRGKINFSNEIVMYVNTLNAMTAGLIRGVDNYLFHKLTQKRGGKLRRLSVLLHDFQEALNVDSLDFGGSYNRPQFFRRLSHETYEPPVQGAGRRAGPGLLGVLHLKNFRPALNEGGNHYSRTSRFRKINLD